MAVKFWLTENHYLIRGIIRVFFANHKHARLYSLNNIKLT